MDSPSPCAFTIQWQGRTYSSSDSENINNDDDDLSDDCSDVNPNANSAVSSIVAQFENGLSCFLSEMDSNDSSIVTDEGAQSKPDTENSRENVQQTYSQSLTESMALSLKPRGYQLELFHRAINENIIICVETGAGKTLISFMLIKHVLENASSLNSSSPLELSNDVHSRSMPDMASVLPVDTNDTVSNPPLLEPNSMSLDLLTSCSTSNGRQPSATVVFLVHRVPLALQQAKVLKTFLPSHFRVGCYCGDRGVDNWSPEHWAAHIARHSVLVMTAQIFLNLLRHGLISIENIALLVVDEAHHATKNHPYRRLFVEFYHSLPAHAHRPRIFGMTATPVKKKNASSRHVDCLAALTSLEATMDATVVTVSADSQQELERLVPKPNEFIVAYESANDEDDDLCSYSTIEETIDSDVFTNILTNSTGCDTSTANPGSLPAAEMKVLTKVNNRLGFIAAKNIAERFCAHHSICPDDTFQILLDQCANLNAGTAGVRDKVVKLFGVLYHEYCRCMEEAREKGMSPGKREKFRAIIFTHERISTVALEVLINSVFAECQCEELTARTVIGINTPKNSVVRMSQSKMQDTVDAFRRGEFGILVATNVVEEGIDIAACRLVVAFDTPDTAAAYIQSRGRARKRGARYITFVNSTADIEQSSLWRVHESARIIVDVSRGAHATEKQRQAVRPSFFQDDDINKEKKLFSRTTTARVTATDAIALLSRYCTIKSRILGADDLADMKFDDISEGKMFTAAVYFDERIPIDGGHCTDPQVSVHLARRLAALDAYRKLYDIGEVDEYLLPKKGARSRRVLEASCGPFDSDFMQRPNCDSSGRKKNSKKKNRLPVEPKASKKHKRMRRCDIAHPFDVKTSEPILKVTPVIDLDAPEPPSRNGEQIYSGDSDLEMVDVADIANEKVFLYEIIIEEELDVLCFGRTPKMYGLASKTKIRTEDLKAVKCPTGEPFLSLKACGELAWGQNDERRAYIFVRAIQICLQGKAPGSDAAVEMEEYYSQGSFTSPTFFLLPLALSETAGYVVDWYSIEKVLSFGWRSGPSERCDSAKMSNSIVCSIHENMERVYYSAELSDSLTANSSARGYLDDKYATFREYYETKHNMEVKDGDQYLLPGYSLREKLSRKNSSSFMLIPDFVRVVPLDPFLCFIARALPLWQKFIALRDCWYRNAIHPISFLEFSRALQPNVDNVSKWNADLCYERNEFLGDSVLKVINSMAKFVLNPDGDEGDLSDARDIEVSNGFLADVAMRMKLHDCIAYSGVSQNSKTWPWFWGSHEKKPINVSEKVLADCVEALIGCHFQNGGLLSACTFLERYGLLPGACQTLGYSVNDNSAPQNTSGVVLSAPSLPPEDDRHESSFITDVERKIGYEFREKRHLVVALTHRSHQNGHCISYQRYEYLGDAIIGFLLLSHFYTIYPHLGPDELTKLRGPALSNDLFARVIVTNGIHELFWYKNRAMQGDIAAAAKAILNEEDDEEDVCKTMKVPKVLGDLFEAILGAIVVDQGMRLTDVKDVALNILGPELDRFANPDRFRLNVISLLLTMVQKSFQEAPKYSFLDEPEDLEKRCEVSVRGTVLGTGTGTSRRLARIAATSEALKKLKAHTGKTVLGKQDPYALLVGDHLIIATTENVETEITPKIGGGPCDVIDLVEDTCEVINLID